MNIVDKFESAMIVKNPSVRLDKCTYNGEYNLSHIRVLKSTDIDLATKFFSILENNIKEYKKELGLNALSLEMNLFKIEKNIFEKEYRRNFVVKVGIKKSFSNNPNEMNVSEKINEIKKTIESWENNEEKRKERKLKSSERGCLMFIFTDSLIQDLTVKERYLLQVNLLKDTIQDFLTSENIHDEQQRWEANIKYCNFLQTMSYTQTLFSDAIYSLILEHDFLNKNFAYKSTIFRALKYSGESFIPYLKEPEIRKLRSIVKILSTHEHSIYLFNGFISQVIMENGYCGSLLNDDFVEMADEILKTEAYQEKDGIEFQHPFELRELLKINNSLKKSLVGEIVENNTGIEIEKENYITIELNTSRFYHTLGIRKHADFKKIIDEIFYNVLEQTVYGKDILLSDETRESVSDKLKFNDGNLKNYLSLKVYENEYQNIGSIKKYMDNVLEETSKVINNIYAERWVDFLSKEQYMGTEIYADKIRRVLRQTTSVIKNEKAREIIAHLRKNELMNKLDMLGKTTEKRKKKI